MSAYRRSLLARTNQTWKVAVLLCGFVGVGLAVAMMFRASAQPQQDFTVPALAIIGIGVPTFVWLLASMRCPRCRRSLGRHVVSQGSSSDWITRLLFADACPACGFTVTTKASPP